MTKIENVEVEEQDGEEFIQNLMKNIKSRKQAIINSISKIENQSESEAINNKKDKNEGLKVDNLNQNLINDENNKFNQILNKRDERKPENKIDTQDLEIRGLKDEHKFSDHISNFREKKESKIEDEPNTKVLEIRDLYIENEFKIPQNLKIEDKNNFKDSISENKKQDEISNSSPIDDEDLEEKSVNDSIVEVSVKMRFQTETEEQDTIQPTYRKDTIEDISIINPESNNHRHNPKLPSASSKYTPNPIIDQSILQKIEKTELEKQKEIQSQLQEIENLESKLTLDQRLMHEKWQIRKNAFKKINEIISSASNSLNTGIGVNKNSQPNESSPFYDKNGLFEAFSPWLKYFISETNVTALFEGLNTFHIFILSAAEFRSKALFDFFDEIEKITNHSKSHINEVCTKIINVFLNTKKIHSSTINEIIKKLNTNNSKLLNFVQNCLLDLIKNQNLINESFLRMILEKSILYYSGSLTSKSVERKKIFSKLITEVYLMIEDDFEVIKRNVNITNYRDLEKLLSNVKKSEKNIIPSNSSDRKTENITFKTFKTENKNEIKYKLYNDTKEIQIEPSESFSHSKIQTEKKLDNSDITLLIPNEFYEITSITQYNKRKETLEKTNKILGTTSEIKDKSKDHREILSNLNYAIDDSNVLVHCEGIKCLNHLCRLLKGYINTAKLKLLLLSCFDKFKDKKSLVKIELCLLFNTILANECLTVDYFLTFILQFTHNAKNPVIKSSLLDYVLSLFTINDQSQIQLLNLESLTPVNYLNFSKTLTETISNESKESIKDICSSLINAFKQKVLGDSEVERKFDNIVSGLTVYRRSVITHGTQSSDEKEYKKNLRRIKSSLSVNRSTSRDVKTPKANFTIKNDVKKVINDRSKSISNNQETNSKLLKDISNAEKNSSNVSKVNKLAPKEKEKEVNRNKIKIKTKNEKNLQEQDIKNNIKRVVLEPEENKNDNSNIKENLDESQLTKRSTNVGVLEKRMESAIDHIYSLDFVSLQDYAKKVIKDFLVFVKTVTSKKLDEDMESHFGVILQILNKIWDRFSKLINQKNKSKLSKPNLFQENSNYSYSDELVIQTVKVIIVTPPFIEDNNLKIFELLKYLMQNLRRIVNNDEKVFYLYLDILNKFVNFEIGSTTFLEDINPRGTVIVFLEYFVNNDEPFDLRQMKVENSLIALLEKASFLSEDEKSLYYKCLSEKEEDNNMQFINTERSLEIRIQSLEKNKNSEISNPKITKHITTDRIYPSNTSPIKDLNLQSSLIGDIKSEMYNDNWGKYSSPNKEDLIIVENTRNKSNQPEQNFNTNKEKDTLEISKEEFLFSEDQSQIFDKSNLENQMQKINENFKERIIESNSKDKININEDIADIRDKIKQKVRKLDMTIQRLGQKIETSTKEEKKEDHLQLISNQVDDSIMLPPQDDFKTLILKIPSHLLDDNIGEISLYIKLEAMFKKLDFKNKQNFINDLKQVLDNSSLIDLSSFNCFTQLFDFLLALLTHEIIANKESTNEVFKVPTVMISLQESIENLMKKKHSETMFKVLINLLKKYLPKDFLQTLAKETLILLKAVSYLFKLLLDKRERSLNSYNILTEINNLFLVFPPSNLRDGVANLDLLDKIYRQLRQLTDYVSVLDVTGTRMFLESLSKSNKSYCSDYLQYLTTVINK